MKKRIFRYLLRTSITTILLALFSFPLLLPTENYFRLVLQILPLAVIILLILLLPLYAISERLSTKVQEQAERLLLDSPSSLERFPELRPLAEQVSALKAQITSQMHAMSGQQEQLQVLTENMQEGLLLIAEDGKILSYNQAALRLLETDAPQPAGSVYTLNDAPLFREIISNAINGTHGETVIYIGDTACQLIANPVAREGMAKGAVLLLLDVTEREKRDALRREFTSNVSHELKTPLTSIYGIADMMESGMVKTEDMSGFAKRIRDESARMIALIEDIIRLSRLDDDSFSEEVLPLDLYEIAEEVLEQLRPSASSKQIKMTLTGTSAPMRGVPVIVEEMLYNLCDNAVKYNKECGTVEMHVSCTAQAAEFTVQDTGIGIPQADCDRIFERFYRVDKSHSRQIGGTGLGLSIVTHGAAFHNAVITLNSQLNVGTTISLQFPREPAAADAKNQAAFAPATVKQPNESEESP